LLNLKVDDHLIKKLILQFAQPGSNTGFFFGTGTSKCPTGVGSWEVYSQVKVVI
jgi:hypothetical protein